MSTKSLYRLVLRYMIPVLLLGAILHLAASPAAANIFGQDDRKEVTSQDYPFCCVGVVFTGNGQGTGFLVGRNLVMTNRHCTLVKGEPAKSLTFKAGMVGGKAAKTSHVTRVWRGRQELDGDTRQDWAVLELEDNLGDELGWLPLCDKLPRSAELIGYSGDFFATTKSAGRSKCTVLEVLQKGILAHDADATRGSSGSPLVAMVQGRPQVVALNFGEFRDDGEESLTVAKFERDHTNLAMPVSNFLDEVSKILGDKTQDEFCDTLQRAKDAMAANEPVAAMVALSVAAQLKPENALVRATRGVVHFKAGNLEAALADVTEAARLDASSLDYAFGKAMLEYHLDKLEDCLATLAEIRKEVPSDVNVNTLYGKVQVRLFVKGSMDLLLAK